MEIGINKRRSLKGRVTRVENAITAHGQASWDKRLVTTYLQQLDQFWNELQVVHEEIGILCTDEQYLVHQNEYDQLANRIESQKLRLPDLDAGVPTPAASSTGNGNGAAAAETTVRLPRLELPTFSGSLHEWTSFHDLFSATINNNERLAGAQKLQYLKASLRGEPAALIQSIQVTDDHFNEAWDILNRRYHNRREIINAHLKILCTQNALSSEAPAALRKLIDVTNETVRALRVLQVPVEHWDILLAYIVTERLDHDSRRQWELTLNTDETVKFVDLMTFLEQRARALLTCVPARPNRPASSPQDRRPVSATRTTHHSGTAREECRICKERHLAYHCGELLQSSIEDRRRLVKEHALCFNCLSSEHRWRQCKSSSCRKCGGNHHTLLHLPTTTTTTQRPVSQNQERETSTTTHHGQLQSDSAQLDQVLLATALVKICDNQGNNQVCRALLDSGSQASFVSEACAQRLGLRKQRTRVAVKGISASNVNVSKGVVNLKLSSFLKQVTNLTVPALVIRKVTGILPSEYLDTTNWKHVPITDLADPEYNIPNNVDVLLGADIYADVVRPGIHRGPHGMPIAQNSTLGWLISGRVNQNHAAVRVSTNFVELDLIQSVQRFWEIEQVPESRMLSTEEMRCEDHFMKTHTRDADGRFTVRLPFKALPVIIDTRESRDAALRRLTQVERKLDQQPPLQQEYCEFLKEYENLGHMEETTKLAALQSSSIYLPHHSVIKEGSTTTRLRVVFDASAKTRLGTSLNDHLMVGPTLQDNIFQILLRFRLHAVAITADINKMYRQIRVHTDDTRYQHIVWRSAPNQPVRDYRLMTLTYGTASAPYLAVRCLQQLAKDRKEDQPMAARAAQRDFYMDDLMSGAATEGDAIQLQVQLTTLLESGGFQLRKWVSSHPAVLQSVPDHLREETTQYPIDADGCIKTLGLQWNPTADQFGYSPNINDKVPINSKRSMLSTLARIYDPMGWLAPVTITGKIMLQQLWTTPCKWDEKLPPGIDEKWKQFQQDLSFLKEVKIPRRITQPLSTQHELHGFCDASEQAYAAVIYLKSTNTTGNIHVALIAAKTRVAPIKRISIPRLELCGALLLARLFDAVREAIPTEAQMIHAWTDSTVALAWINAESSRWKTFVGNRVSKIQASVPAQCWKHVKGEENPADCATRGIFPREAAGHNLWWSGPNWLKDLLKMGTNSPREGASDLIQCEERSTHVTQVVVPFLLEKFSDMRTLTRVSVYVFRFIGNCQKPPDKRQTGPPTSEELNHVLFFWIRTAQKQEFPEEVICLAKQSSCPSGSRLATLSPFLDTNGLIRVGGRLQNAEIDIERKHPIVLPHKHIITTLIIRQEHLRTLHAGPQLLLYSLQQRYWIIGARNAIRQHVQQCIKCWRQRALPTRPMMGSLPQARVTPGRPFLRCGVDYAGPLTIRAMKLRGQKSFKAYVAVFVCFSTHAIHLELVSDLTTEAFLAALKRFVSRRGHCSDIYSDQGTNFIGASRELKDLRRLISTPQHKEAVARQLGETRTAWHFNPPAAPHFGGLWEAGVKSMKHHLRRIVGNVSLNFEEMSTVLAQIEACVNSRPLSPMSSSPDDVAALTPGHFLIGGPLLAIPEPDYTTVKITHLSRWQLLQRLIQHFWKRWSQEFLSRLQQRPKSWTNTTAIKVNDLVILKEENQSPMNWKLGRIIETHPGKDGIVRVVSVKTATGELKRPVVKVCKLPMDDPVSV